MSIERELLEKVISGDNKGDFFVSYDLYKEIYEFLAQPEQTEQDPVAWMQDSIELYVLEEKSAIRGYVIPLYTAPPKREPLSDKEITKNTPKLIHIGERLAFHAGVRFAEKHHGIGDE